MVLGLLASVDAGQGAVFKSAKPTESSDIAPKTPSVVGPACIIALSEQLRCCERLRRTTSDGRLQNSAELSNDAAAPAPRLGGRLQACFNLWQQRLDLLEGHMTPPLTKSVVVFLRDADEKKPFDRCPVHTREFPG